MTAVDDEVSPAPMVFLSVCFSLKSSSALRCPGERTRSRGKTTPDRKARRHNNPPF
jgi:hypothetical protein